MAWRVEGGDVLDNWATTCSAFDSLFIVALWLERVRASGPSADDDVVNGVAVHADGPVMIRYRADAAEFVLTVVSIIDVA